MAANLNLVKGPFAEATPPSRVGAAADAESPAPGPALPPREHFRRSSRMALIADLALRQLDAYNAGDLEAFCACYHPEVLVLHDRVEAVTGLEAFRDRYRDLFERWTFGASVSSRLVLGVHAIDLERWWRVDPESGLRSEGDVLVRYTLRDASIGVVQFLRG